MWGAVIIGAVLLIAVISYTQYLARRDTYKPLSRRQPARPASEDTPLGYEELDMDSVARVNRRNESLERGHTNWTRRGSGFLRRATGSEAEPLPDDETYAARFHSAFHTNKSKD